MANGDGATWENDTRMKVWCSQDRSLEDAENLPEPEVLAADIVEDLRTALEAFEEVAAELADSGGG